MYQYDETNALKHIIISSLNNCKKYNYNINYTNQIVINVDVKFVLIEKIFKNYKLVHINKNIQNVKWNVNYIVFKTINDLNMSLKIVHNVDVEFFRVNLDFYRCDIDLFWINQIKVCYENLQRLNENYVSKKLKIIRKHNKLMNYAIIFANRDELMYFHVCYSTFCDRNWFVVIRKR